MREAPVLSYPPANGEKPEIDVGKRFFTVEKPLEDILKCPMSKVQLTTE